MKQIVKDAIILTVITLISGCLLGLVYEITKEPIAVAQYNTQQKAYKTVFETAETFEDLENFEVTENGGTTVENAVVAKDTSGNALGYVITVTSHEGYGGDITFSVGITNEGVVNGYSITSISETAGLGMKAKEEAFSSQFNEKSAASFEVVKGTATADNQIEAISGATITSSAVTNGVNAALSYFGTITEGGSTNE